MVTKYSKMDDSNLNQYLVNVKVKELIAIFTEMVKTRVNGQIIYLFIVFLFMDRNKLLNYYLKKNEMNIE